jgi:hypothetical protein
MTAMVAGILPVDLTILSTDWAISNEVGYGIPWVMIVDSRATTGFPVANASSTSG